MSKSETIAQRMEETRIQAGAQSYKGHDYMDLARFDENTRHMIIFHVLTHDSPVGDKGDKMRLFLSDKGYQKALENEKHGNIQIAGYNELRLDDANTLAGTYYTKRVPATRGKILLIRRNPNDEINVSVNSR